MNAPLDSVMTAAVRRALVLRPELAPRVTPHPLSGRAGVPEALAAARAGDIKLLDAIELAWLNAWGPRPPAERFSANDRLVTLALDIVRGYGCNGEDAIEWGLVLPCGRCYGRVITDPHCRHCGGRKHLSEDWECVYTDWNLQELER